MPPKTNAAGKPKLNAKRSRKIRTAVVESSSSSSSSEASSDTDSSDSSSAASHSVPTPAKKQKTTASTTTTTTTTTATRDAVASSSSSSSDSEDSERVASASVSAAAFPSWYLRSVTQELAEDLDKVRSAPDFGDAALPLLVHALQQGEGVFSGGEKARVMAAAGER